MTGNLTYAAVSQRQADLQMAAARHRRVPRKPRGGGRLPLLPRPRRRRRAFA